jgi:hypothetical protein
MTRRQIMSTLPFRRARSIMHPIAVAAVVAAVMLPASPPVAAQAQSSTRESQPTPPGWVFMPGISVAETWDSNVLLSTEGSESAADFLTAISPRASLGYRGRRDTFQADYHGTYQLYQDLSELNAFDQRSNTSYSHRVSPGLTIFARNSLSKSPTTDDVDIPGVVFRRQGVVLDDFRSGLEARFTKRASLTAAYAFQYVNFDEENALVPIDGLRRGGHAHGGSGEFDYAVGPWLTVGAEYDMRRGTVDEIREFDVMNALGTVDWRLAERIKLSAGAGYAWLRTSPADEHRSAPAFRVALDGSGPRLAWTVSYRRSFLPSFGFGGTFQNQEFQAGLLAPLTRRMDFSGSFSIRENDPLSSDPLLNETVGLRSMRARSSVSYLATRWMRIEGFYLAVFQDSQRPGGEINRSRAGVQVVTYTRMRVR